MPIARVSRTDALSKHTFHVKLQHWLQTTNEAIVGDPNIYPQTPWIWVKDGGSEYILHPDTTRVAITAYLSLVQQYGDGIDWLVVPSQRGKLTKIAFGPDAQTIKGFYLYIGQP